MRPNGPPRRAVSTKSLVLAFAGALVLALVTMGVAVLELERVQRESEVLADEVQHATYYLGDVDEKLARLRSRVALGLEDPEEFAGGTEMVSQIDENLQQGIDGLATGLDPVSQQRWIASKRELERLRADYTNAASLIQTGQSSRAAAVLAGDARSDARIHDTLDDLERTHREEMLIALRRGSQRASRVRLLATSMVGSFTAGILAIAGIVTGTLRQQERRVAEHTTRLESANADLEAFAGRVAHDLRNALGPVVIAPSMLRRFVEDPSRVLEVADRTERCSRRAIAIVDALLAFSRASRGVEARESAALPSGVRNVVDELAPLAAKLGVSFEVEEIPELQVRCSPGLLHIVLANLCGNAVKFLEGQAERRVRISAHRDDSWCRIEVEDTGPGIPIEAHEKIFEPFFRVEGTRAPGTGVGLATVRRILDARGGRIAVESAEGRGSRFLVWLSLAPSADDRPRMPEPDVRHALHH